MRNQIGAFRVHIRLGTFSRLRHTFLASPLKMDLRSICEQRRPDQTAHAQSDRAFAVRLYSRIIIDTVDSIALIRLRCTMDSKRKKVSGCVAQ